MASSVKPARIGSSPATSLEVLPGPGTGTQGPRRRWPWVVAALLVLALAGAVALVVRLAHSVETFALTLEIKTADGKRSIRVTGNDVVVDERPRKGPPIVTRCLIGMNDSLALQSLARRKLVEDGLDGRPSIGTFMTTAGSTDEVSNGDLDAETGAIVSDFILKRVTTCLVQP